MDDVGHKLNAVYQARLAVLAAQGNPATQEQATAKDQVEADYALATSAWKSALAIEEAVGDLFDLASAAYGATSLSS